MHKWLSFSCRMSNQRSFLSEIPHSLELAAAQAVTNSQTSICGLFPYTITKISTHTPKPGTAPPDQQRLHQIFTRSFPSHPQPNQQQRKTTCRACSSPGRALNKQNPPPPQIMYLKLKVLSQERRFPLHLPHRSWRCGLLGSTWRSFTGQVQRVCLQLCGEAASAGERGAARGCGGRRLPGR